MNGKENLNSSSVHKTIDIIVNGKQKIVKKDFISYEEIIALAFETPPSGDGVQFSITYTNGNNNKPKGALIEGESVKTKEGMEFDVTPTNRS